MEVGRTTAVNTGLFTVMTDAARAGIGTGLHAIGALTIGLGRTHLEASRATAGGLVVDFHITDGWAVGSAEVIATGGTGTNTTVIATAKVAVLVASNVGAVTGNKVVTTAPGGTVAAGTILVVTIVATGMFEVVGQREQEVRIVSCVATVVPVGGRITTDQPLTGLTCIELGHHDRGSFAVTLAVERRDAVPITAQLITQDPILVGCVVPGVDTLHMGCCQ